LLYLPSGGYAEGNLNALHKMLTHSRTTASLSDAGAHCPSICDASFTTFMLTHWVKGCSKGARMQMEKVVRKQTSEPAGLYALQDRGVITVGKKADGFSYTIVSGEVVVKNGEITKAMPGRLIRGPQSLSA
jgi:N-acyl-D-amino-acid deacylase